MTSYIFLPVRPGTYGSDVHEWVAANKESVQWVDINLLKFFSMEALLVYRLKFGDLFNHPNFTLIHEV